MHGLRPSSPSIGVSPLGRLAQLPEELLPEVLAYLTLEELGPVRGTCRALNRLMERERNLPVAASHALARARDAAKSGTPSACDAAATVLQAYFRNAGTREAARNALQCWRVATDRFLVVRASGKPTAFYLATFPQALLLAHRAVSPAFASLMDESIRADAFVASLQVATARVVGSAPPLESPAWASKAWRKEMLRQRACSSDVQCTAAHLLSHFPSKDVVESFGLGPYARAVLHATSACIAL